LSVLKDTSPTTLLLLLLVRREERIISVILYNPVHQWPAS